MNAALARRRATMVERFLFSRAPDVGMRHSVVARSFGEELSHRQTENYGMYRSALVLVNRPARLETPSPPPAPLRSPIFNYFRIRMTGTTEFGEVAVGIAAQFEIDYDIARPNSPPSDPIRYVLMGGGIGFGIPVSSGSADGEPVWNSFTSPRLRTTRGFNGQARIMSGGASIHRASLSLFNVLRLIPDGPSSGVLIESFQTGGLGMSAGASVIQGRFYIP